jgi:hypothetical protein
MYSALIALAWGVASGRNSYTIAAGVCAVQKEILMYIWRGLGALGMLLLGGTISLHAAALDANLYTIYSLGTAPKDLYWEVCGATQDSFGCFGSGNIGPFGNVGAIIEGNPIQDLKTGTVTRYIYVVDTAYGSSGDGVELYVYEKVDTITVSSDKVSVKLFKSVSLPLTGGSSAVAFMAANPKFLFIGTNQTGVVALITKSNLKIAQVGDTIPVTSAITADKYGFVTVTWENGGGFGVYNPDGSVSEGGGGTEFMLNTIQAAVPLTLP